MVIMDLNKVCSYNTYSKTNSYPVKKNCGVTANLTQIMKDLIESTHIICDF